MEVSRRNFGRPPAGVSIIMKAILRIGGGATEEIMTVKATETAPSSN
jgi:hypothetical protein